MWEVATKNERVSGHACPKFTGEIRRGGSWGRSPVPMNERLEIYLVYMLATETGNKHTSTTGFVAAGKGFPRKREEGERNHTDFKYSIKVIKG